MRPYRPLGWQSSCFLTDRAEAERAYTLAEQLGSVNAAAAELAPPGPRYATPGPALLARQHHLLASAREQLPDGLD